MAGREPPTKTGPTLLEEISVQELIDQEQVVDTLATAPIADVAQAAAAVQGAQTTPADQWTSFVSLIWGAVAVGLAWILDFQAAIFGYTLAYDGFALTALKVALLLPPAAALMAGVWGTSASVVSLPFRSGRGEFLSSLLISWWDAIRMTWFYWAGIGRLAIVLVGWFWGFVKLAFATLKGALTSPFAVLDWTSRKYFQPGVPWIAFFLVLFWSAIEATIFTFTLRPTMGELLADMTGYELNSTVLSTMLWLFLFPLIAGSFACIQVLNEAIKSRQVGQIISMVLVEVVVAMFEVLFLYRELVDAITPWLAQQGLVLGIVGTLVIAFAGWVGVRGMTWFLFGRYGTPALQAVLSRQTISRDNDLVEAARKAPDAWRGPIAALKTDTEWFKREAREVFELLSLPMLQLLAAGFNFGVVVIAGKPWFALPFRTLDDVLAITPAISSARAARSEAKAEVVTP